MMIENACMPKFAIIPSCHSTELLFHNAHRQAFPHSHVVGTKQVSCCQTNEKVGKMKISRTTDIDVL